MNEWFKRTFDKIKALWSKWTRVQRVVFITILVVSVVALGFLLTFNVTPTLVPILNRPITD